MSKEGNPLKVSITGIDGAGKSTVVEDVVNSLGDLTVAKIVRPVYTHIDEQREYHFSKLMKVVDFAHNMGDRMQSKKLSITANAIDVILQGRVIEPHFIRNLNPELMLGARDYLIDPAVYAVYYSPRLADRSMKERIDFFQKLTGVSVRDVIFFLTVPPEEAVARIERRIQLEAEGTSSKRPKWRHMHENPRDLGILQEEYYSALDEIGRRSDPEIVEIDTSMYTQAEVATTITAVIKGKLNGRFK